MQPIICHCCGQVIGEVPELSRLRGELSHREFSVMEKIFKAGTEGITSKALSQAVFGDRLGDHPRKLDETRVLVSRIRPKIERFGFFIPKSNRWSRYRVQPLEATL
jgi:hypothetical protein